MRKHPALPHENLIRHCWAKVEWGYGRILVRDGANAGWIEPAELHDAIALIRRIHDRYSASTTAGAFTEKN